MQWQRKVPSVLRSKSDDPSLPRLGRQRSWLLRSKSDDPSLPRQGRQRSWLLRSKSDDPNPCKYLRAKPSRF
ncbi:hypothetical protein [Anaerotignum neopropionicum]|uniref:hypothetical protein n=1 Tax=Anaerotignum neopropionicum TaxID=36847 RepID=UPI00138F1C7A|nr:hypothetical protein [Anaerotignum neopropionicum]